MDLQAEEKRFLMAITVKGLIPLARERTLQSFYYVLKGRKSNQTYQDVHMYSLFSYYRLFPQLSKEKWQEIVLALQASELLQSVNLDNRESKQTFVVTEKGNEWLQEVEEEYQLQEWLEPFYSFTQSTELVPFWMKLHLMVQTVSQILGNNRSFFPVVASKEVQQWVKQQLSSRASREAWLANLGQELFYLLQYFPLPQQRLIVDQLSGVSQAGLTLDQIAQREHEPPSFTKIKFRYMLAKLIANIREDNGERNPLLAQIAVSRDQRRLPISDSAYKTYQLLAHEKNIEALARRRNLRIGTIEDHLIEITLNCPEWDHTFYLSQEAKEEIVATSEQYGTKRLRLIKEYLGNQYSYLQIRLALALKKGTER